MIVQSESSAPACASLEIYADALRTRRRLRAETAWASGIKMLFPIVLFILPVLFIHHPGARHVERDERLEAAGEDGRRPQAVQRNLNRFPKTSCSS